MSLEVYDTQIQRIFLIYLGNFKRTLKFKQKTFALKNAVKLELNQALNMLRIEETDDFFKSSSN